MSEKTAAILYEEIIEQIKAKLGCHTESTINFIRNMTKNYSEVLGYSEYEILKAIESKRTYSAANYYQLSKFPILDNRVKIFATTTELLETTKNTKFICPACKKVQLSPYACTDKDCDWKSYGLLGTLDRGFRFTIKDSFLDTPMIDDCFLPVAFADSIYDPKSVSYESN